MKKTFKALSILGAATALTAGIAVAASGCSNGYNGTYAGDYHYLSAQGTTYGIKVEVTVENNVITKVVDVTTADDNYVVVSPAMPLYGWEASNVKNWSNHESWLLQQYVGWTVADVLDIKVFTDTAYEKVGDGYQRVPGTKGEPYDVAWNAELQASGLVISGATVGSGRVLLAIQDALSK